MAKFHPDARQPEFESEQILLALRGCLGRIEDQLGFKPLSVSAQSLCEVYLRGRPLGKGIHQKTLRIGDLVGKRSR
jgi:hypothetical protein